MDCPLRLADQLRAHLRSLRSQRGLTQAQQGERLGLGQVRIADIEARPGAISVDQLMRNLAALGVTLVLRDEIATVEGPTPASPAQGAPPGDTAKPGKQGPSTERTRKGSW